MDIKQLKTLVHVAELGSLSKASVRLGIAQPALSRQIRMLEAELGGTLFERHGRGMVPTAAGREVLDRAGRILRDVEALRLAASPTGSELVGRVGIGTTPTVGEVVTVPLVTRLKRAHPRISVQLSSAFSGHLIDWVKSGQLDFAIVYNTETTPLLDIEPLLTEELLLVGSAADGLLMDQPVPFATLADEPLVLPTPAHGLRGIADAFAKQSGVGLSPTIETDSFNAMLSLVQSGFGKTLLPLAPIYNAIRAGTVSAAPLRDPTPVRRLGLAFSSSHSRSVLSRVAAQVLKQITTELVEEGVWVGQLLF